jgi:CubicO group peptidase (beta-lactamase class C family)
VDESALARADEELRRNRPNAYALLVQQAGRVIFERYYGGRSPEDRLDLRSATKSVLSALVGIAIGRGLLAGLDEPIDALLPEQAGPGTAGLTLDHVLTMTAGLAWDETVDFGRLGHDWVSEMLARPRVAPPGQAFAYSSALSQVAAAALSRQRVGDLTAFAQRELFDRLEIAPPRWERAPDGLPIGGFGLWLTARDAARIGELFLRRGRWANEPVVPERYVAAATSPASAGGFPEEVPYGRGWWVSDESGRPGFFAAGYGGQYVYVVPALELVCVTAADPSLPPWDERQDLRGLIVGIAGGAPGPGRSSG